MCTEEHLQSTARTVPEELYPWPSYPDYTAGAGYVVSGDVAAKIYQASLVLKPSMYIDDVFMGICAKAMGVFPQHHVYFSGEGKAPYHPCIYGHMITSHGHSTDVRSLWKAATDPAMYYLSRGFMANLYCTAVRVILLCRPYYQNTYSCMAAFTWPVKWWTLKVPYNKQTYLPQIHWCFAIIDSLNQLIKVINYIIYWLYSLVEYRAKLSFHCHCVCLKQTHALNCSSVRSVFT